ncbi:MAG: PQQ-binding-like beta-propeller repeat protein, partial [Haliea sp.]|nr:PQQ-binding-like beta-propeller repeat protein [Haliea sp.]
MRFFSMLCFCFCLFTHVASAAPVSEERLLTAGSDVDNWLSYGRDYSEQRFTPLGQINTENIAELGMAWYFETDTHLGLQSTPLAIDGVLYFSGAWNTVWAVDGASGEMLWKFDPQVPRSKSITACCGVLNRGLAAWEDLLYIGTLDGRLLAIERATGTLRWSAQTTDPNQAYSITGAPRVARGKVFIGNGGSEFGTRGFVTAYDAASGELAWRFYT